MIEFHLPVDPFLSSGQEIENEPEELFDATLTIPVINTSPLPYYDYDRLDYGMTIGIERTPEGRIWGGGTWATHCDNPDAENPAWSTPVRIWHGCSLNKPNVLSDGTWLLHISLWDDGRISDPFKAAPSELIRK